MKIIKNFLDERMIQKILQNNEELGPDGFEDSDDIWPDELIRPGSHIKVRHLSLKKRYILSELMKEHGLMKQDFTGPFQVMAYKWMPMSHIPWHSDKGHEVGVTIYLNKNWDLNWGGLLLYKDKVTGKINVLPPTYNMAVINNDTVEHATTMVTPDAPIRLTIQCFWRTVVSG